MQIETVAKGETRERSKYIEGKRLKRGEEEESGPSPINVGELALSCRTVVIRLTLGMRGPKDCLSQEAAFGVCSRLGVTLLGVNP